MEPEVPIKKLETMVKLDAVRQPQAGLNTGTHSEPGCSTLSQQHGVTPLREECGQQGPTDCTYRQPHPSPVLAYVCACLCVGVCKCKRQSISHLR